jgi:hypothetical protein
MFCFKNPWDRKNANCGDENKLGEYFWAAERSVMAEGILQHTYEDS